MVILRVVLLLSFFVSVSCWGFVQLLDSPLVGQLFPADVISRATEYLSRIRGGTGAYTESAGADICRQHVAEGIAERDGFPCNKDDIFISDGASQVCSLHRALAYHHTYILSCLTPVSCILVCAKLKP